MASGTQQIRVGQLWQGLSSQAPWRQFPGQTKDMLNMALDVTVGARTRSGTRLIGEIDTNILDFALTVEDMRMFHFQGDLIVVGSDPQTGLGFLKVFDSLTLQSLLVTGDLSYMDDAFKATIDFTAIRDTVIILNREVVPQALTSAPYTLAGTVDQHSELSATPIIDEVYFVSREQGIIPRGFYKTPSATPLSQDWFRVPAPSQADAVLQGESMPHQLVRVFDDDLTVGNRAGNDLVLGVTVTGDASSAVGILRSFDNANTPTQITIERTTTQQEYTPGEQLSFSGAATGTMDMDAAPSNYFPSSVKSFKFVEIVWTQRLSGTAATNPVPVWAQTATQSGGPLDAIEFHHSRLFLVGNNAVTFSDGRDRVNFFLTDVTSIIPIFTSTGSIDINTPTAGEIQFALSSKNSLVLIGQNAQLSFTSGQERLSSVNGTVEPISEFNNSSTIPVAAGDLVTIIDEFGSVNDFGFDPVSAFTAFKGNRAAQTLRIFENTNIFQIFTFDDTTFFIGDEDTRMHQRTTIQGQEIQSGWSKLRFPGTTVFMWQFEDRIFLLERDTDRQAYVVLDYIHRQEPLPDGFCFAPAMDYMRSVSATIYDPDEDETEFLYANASLKTRACKQDTINPCRIEWWDIPNPTLDTLINRLNAAIDEASIDYVLNENDVVDPFDDSANQNIIGGQGTYDAGGDFYLVEPFISANIFTVGTALTVSSGVNAADVIDDNFGTFWQSLPIGSDPNPTITYDFGVGVDQLLVRYEVGATTTDSPDSWTFEGSHNNFTWTILDTQTGQNIPASTSIEYPFTNTISYRYYRLRNILETGGDGARVAKWKSGILASNDLDLESDSLAATLSPTGAILTLVYDGELSLGVELQVFVSRDDGTTFVPITMVEDSLRLDGKRILRGEMEWTDNIFGQLIKWKVVMTGLANITGTTLHGVALQWFDSRDGDGNQILKPDRILSDRFFVRGDQRGEYIIGEVFDWFILLTELYDGASNVTPIISKLSFFYINSRQFDVGVKRKAANADPIIQTFNTGNIGGNIVNANLIQTGMGMFTVGLDGRGADIVFSGTGPIVTTLSAIEYIVRVKGKPLGFGAQSESFGG